MKKIILLLLLVLASGKIFSQNYTKEEILHNADAPHFAKLTVQPAVNYFDVLRAFKAYEKENPAIKHEKIVNQDGEEEEQEETDRWRFYFKRWNSRVSAFVRADGSIITNDDPTVKQYINNKQNEILNGSTGTANKPTGLGWRVVGPKVMINANTSDTADVQANIYCVHFNQSNPAIGFCGTETGYLFKTTDGGENWSLVGMGMIFSGGVRSVTTVPGNANIVYAGDANNVYKSIDGGLTWAPILSNTGVVWSIIVNPQQFQTVILASSAGVYQSYNGGSSFALRHAGKITGMEYKPGDTSIVYAFTTREVATASYPTGNYNSNFYKSTNGGQTFTIRTNGWFSYNSSRKYMYMTGDITVSANNPNIVYALMAGEETDLVNAANTKKGEIGVLRSTDAGESWAFAHGPFAPPNLMTFGVSSNFNTAYWQNDYNNWIIANPANASEVILGALSGFKSTNQGTSWTCLLGYSGSYNSHPDHQNFFMSGSNLWIANDGGLLKSTDFLATAPKVKAKGIFASEFWGFDVGWNQEIVTGGRYHNGNATYNGGVNPANTFIRMGGAESPTGYASPYEAKVYHSDIGGYSLNNTFPQVQSIANLSKYPFETYIGVIGYSNLVYHPNKKNVLFLGEGNSFWKSNDAGASFTSLYTFANAVADIDLSLRAPDTIMLTTNTDNKMWLSTNGGTTFTDITGTLPAGIKRLCMNPVNPAECWVLLWNTGNVYRTTNMGTTWTSVGGGNLTGKQGIDIFVQASATDPTCYVACNNNGVYYKNNSTSSNWTVLNLDLPAAISPRRIQPFYSKNKFFMGTNGIGIWEHDLMNPVLPFANFASNKQLLDCSKDTVLFYDYSIVDESSAPATRTWSFPGAAYVNTTNPKQPKVLYNVAGNYNVTLTVTDAGNNTHTRTMNNFISFGTIDVCKIDTMPGLALSTNPTGSNRFDIGSAGINGNNFTISFWVKPNGNQASFSQILGTNSPNTFFGIGFAFNGYSPNLNLIYSHSSVGYGINSTINMDVNAWNYVTLVYTSTGVTIYKNGQAPGWSYTTGTFSNVDFSSGGVFINPDIHGQGGDFKGELDELAIYNTALTLPQIREYMHLTKNATTPNLVKYVQFNQYSASNATVYDAVGSGSALVPNASIITSSAPVGSGTVQTLNNVNAAGTYTFGSTGLSMTLPGGGTYPNGTLVGFKLNVPPDTKPNADSTFPRHTYWIVNNYGANTSFTQLSSLKFSGLYKNPSYTYSNNEFKLYKRASTAFGNTWGSIQDVSDLVTVNPNNIDITFAAGNNVTSFSQLVLTANNPIALPIEGINLDASLASNAVKLDGHVDIQGKVKRLTIERMRNNQTKVIIEEDVSALQSGKHNITRFDEDVEPGNRYYYRLIATSVDDKLIYGTYQFVNIPLANGVFNAYPNPAENWITFTFNNTGETKGYILIHDVAGRLLKQINVSLRKGGNSIMCHVGDLASGIYEATLMLGNGQKYNIKINKGS